MFKQYLKWPFYYISTTSVPYATSATYSLWVKTNTARGCQSKSRST